jgi:predicted signal transduction protein with EAL and GGDEF domain
VRAADKSIRRDEHLTPKNVNLCARAADVARYLKGRRIRSGNKRAEGCGLKVASRTLTLMSRVHESTRQINALAEIGVRLAVDDFGTGYSSLS